MVIVQTNCIMQTTCMHLRSRCLVCISLRSLRNTSLALCADVGRFLPFCNLSWCTSFTEGPPVGQGKWGILCPGLVEGWQQRPHCWFILQKEILPFSAEPRTFHVAFFFPSSSSLTCRPGKRPDYAPSSSSKGKEQALLDLHVVCDENKKHEWSCTIVFRGDHLFSAAHKLSQLPLCRITCQT